MEPRKITVFGGSTPKADEPAYQFAYQLGRALALAGYTVITGGYIGTMEAVSRGANEAGGHVIGITCAEIEKWRPVGANPWVIEEIKFPTLRQRLYALIEMGDACLALPGGIGTLAEVAVMWSQMQVGATTSRPLILIGEGWKTTISTFIDELGAYIPAPYRNLLHYANDLDTILATLRKSLV
jgi:uncharacterized protein (TIGR00730 family)